MPSVSLSREPLLFTGSGSVRVWGLRSALGRGSRARMQLRKKEATSAGLQRA